ncbi:hypothetical protein B7P34_00855 [Streptosporangium nondiastaticum]|uniref:Uncharacterized protein n=2 Tax=Streptosporangium nondiastaticum TaxID=35764 RepID=A0A9X7JVS9_9ACTN|nr:hypothetical protein B7P34_00855 [Streptosporangium nondiastaticum]
MKKSQGGTVDRGVYLLLTFVVVGLGWVIAAANTGISYLVLSMDWIAISTGLLGCVVFAIVLRFLHCAWWLAVVSLAPAVFVLVGSVQYAPEETLDGRGIRESVLITGDKAAEGGKNHRFILNGRSGRLKETLDYNGDSPQWKAGDRVEVIYDPKGVVPLAVASDVDPDSKLEMLAMGLTGWTGITLLAGRRGFVRRSAGRRPVFDDTGL